MTRPAVGRGWRASRIALRLLAFNVLVLFVPVVGMLYLPIYEARLLDAQERSMVQQARIFAAALGGGDGLDPASAQTILNRLGKRSDARLRVFDTGGVLIADSARAVDQQPEDELAGRKYVAPSGVRQRTLYRVGVVLERMRSWMTSAVRLVRPRTGIPVLSISRERSMPNCRPRSQAATARRRGAPGASDR